ncbi:MAG: hypothetical protein ABI743_07295 [bacterium]
MTDTNPPVTASRRPWPRWLVAVLLFVLVLAGGVKSMLTWHDIQVRVGALPATWTPGCVELTHGDWQAASTRYGIEGAGPIVDTILPQWLATDDGMIVPLTRIVRGTRNVPEAFTVLQRVLADGQVVESEAMPVASGLSASWIGPRDAPRMAATGTALWLADPRADRQGRFRFFRLNPVTLEVETELQVGLMALKSFAGGTPQQLTGLLAPSDTELWTIWMMVDAAGQSQWAFVVLDAASGQPLRTMQPQIPQPATAKPLVDFELSPDDQIIVRGHPGDLPSMMVDPVSGVSTALGSQNIKRVFPPWSRTTPAPGQATIATLGTPAADLACNWATTFQSPPPWRMGYFHGRNPWQKELLDRLGFRFVRPWEVDYAYAHSLDLAAPSIMFPTPGQSHSPRLPLPEDLADVAEVTLRHNHGIGLWCFALDGTSMLVVQLVDPSPLSLNGGHGLLRLGLLQSGPQPLQWLGWIPIAAPQEAATVAKDLQIYVQGEQWILGLQWEEWDPAEGIGLAQDRQWIAIPRPSAAPIVPSHRWLLAGQGDRFRY